MCLHVLQVGLLRFRLTSLAALRMLRTWLLRAYLLYLPGAQDSRTTVPRQIQAFESLQALQAKTYYQHNLGQKADFRI